MSSITQDCEDLYDYRGACYSHPPHSYTSRATTTSALCIMDDLAGLDWSSSSSQISAKPAPMSSSNYFPTLRPTPPISGRSTPSITKPVASSNKAGSISQAPSKSSTPTNDSFANLVSFNASQSLKNVSLQDRQRILQEQQRNQELDRRKRFDIQYGTQDSSIWSKLGDGRATPDRITSPPTYAGTDEYGGRKLSTAINKPFAAIDRASVAKSTRKLSENEDDLLAAFDAEAPVDSSSNFPVPVNGRNSPMYRRTTVDEEYLTLQEVADPDGHSEANIDNDLFGLGTMISANAALPIPSSQDLTDDDVLGLLGRPLSEMPMQPSKDRTSPSHEASENSSQLGKAIAELVSMGFSPEKSKRALQTTDSGLDIQGAVGRLLDQAHDESRQKPRIQVPPRKNSGEARERQATSRPTRRGSQEDNTLMPAWMRQQSRSNSSQRRQESRSPVNGDKDPGKYATDIGSNLFKTANTFWKTSTKKLNQAVSEFNSDSDSSQPKWMREVQNGQQEPRRKQSRKPDRPIEPEDLPTMGPRRVDPVSRGLDITDEALMLESANAHPRIRKQPKVPKAALNLDHAPLSSEEHPPSALEQSRITQPVLPKIARQTNSGDPRSKLSRQALEEQTSQAYVSPARRKRPVPEPRPGEGDLISNVSSSAVVASHIKPKPVTQIQTRHPPPLAQQPILKARQIPLLSSIALQASTSHRHAGTSAYKLGNYAQATASYTSSLSSLPLSHPLTVVLLTNRAHTHLNTGDPKACISDADAALAVIGPLKGEGELIELGSEEGSKVMTEFWSKAMTRKAEALEQLERWDDAAKIWKECVEAGVGGNTSVQGRNRCEKAAGSGSLQRNSVTQKSQSVIRKPPSKSKPKASTFDDVSGTRFADVPSSAEAVNRLRAANAQAERVDDEKFALADSVDERLTKWRKGKEGNLRALLGSLDTVLWEGAGWKKVGMSELIVPGKVKVAYIKGISKVHPDKVCSS